MSDKYEKMSLFEQLQAGLEDSIAYTKGQISLNTTTLPAPPPPVCATEVSRLRRKLRMSQAVFAATLNVSARTIQSWEQGTRKPSDAALRMIQVVTKSPEVISAIFSTSNRRSTRRESRSMNSRTKSAVAHARKK